MFGNGKMARTTITNTGQAIENDTYFVENETPVGSINGSNTTFTLASAPNPSGSLEVFVNGQKMTVTEDYSLSEDTLTSVLAFPTGTILRVNYRVKPS